MEESWRQLMQLERHHHRGLRHRYRHQTRWPECLMSRISADNSEKSVGGDDAVRQIGDCGFWCRWRSARGLLMTIYHQICQASKSCRTHFEHAVCSHAEGL